jgi:hypothetical protein
LMPLSDERQTIPFGMELRAKILLNASLAGDRALHEDRVHEWAAA